MKNYVVVLFVALAFSLGASAKAKKPPAVAHPHLEMLKYRLAKYLPPGEDTELQKLDLRYTIVADGDELQLATVDFFTRTFAPLALRQVGMDDVASRLETLPKISTRQIALDLVDDLASIRKQAVNTEVEDPQVRMKMAQLVGQLRIICRRAGQNTAAAKGMSAEQRYTRASFEADKLGDDVQEILRFTIDAGIDAEVLGPAFEKYLRAITKYVQPVVAKEKPKKMVKKSLKKKTKRKAKRRRHKKRRTKAHDDDFD